MSDPYATQKKAKEDSQRRILGCLRDRPSTFKELLIRASLSAPTLTKHLKDLASKGLVRQRVENGDVLYESTEKAKQAEDSATKTLIFGLQKVKSLPQDEKNLNMMLAILNLAKERPEYFAIIMDWTSQLTNMMISRGKISLLGSKEAQRKFQEAISERLPKTTHQINTPAELREALDKMLNVIKQVIENDSKKSTWKE